jgi:DNA primase
MIDFNRLLKDHNINYVNEVDGWTNFPCPFHDNGKRGNKAGFNHAGEYIYCWVCGNSRLEKVLSELLQVSFYEAKKILEEYSIEGSIRIKLNKKVSKGKKIILPGIDLDSDEKAFDYLTTRRFDPMKLEWQYGITAGGILGDYSFRIIIPIIYKHMLVSFQARSIYSKEKCDELGILRYKNYPIELGLVNIKHILYNLDNCSEDWLVVVEGVFDCWRLGPKNIAATMGTSMSNQQINLLTKRYKKVVFIFDNEKQAQYRAKKYGEQLSALGVEVEIFNPEFEHDPGDYTKEEELAVRRELCLDI